MHIFTATGINNSIADWLEQIRLFHVDELLHLHADEIAEWITDDETEIRERQRMFRDCLAEDELIHIFGKMLDAAEQIKDLKQKGVDYITDVERTLCNIRSLQIYIDAVREISAVYASLSSKISSQRLADLLRVFCEIEQSDAFKDLCAEIKMISDKSEEIKSITLAVNLNAQLQPSEVGILSINSTYFQAENIYTKLFGKKAESGRAIPLFAPDGNEQALEQALYSNLNRTICKGVQKLQREYLRQCNQIVAPIFDNLREITFLSKGTDFIKRLKKRCADYCFPNISATETRYIGLYDPMLLDKMTFPAIVGNDISFDPKKTFIYLLTGVNSGGKTVFLHCVGINQVLFQLGLCVTANAATIRPCRVLFAHFAAKGSDEGGRFSAECDHVRGILEKSGNDTLVLMDEAFSSTNSEEGAAISYQVLRRMQSTAVWCIFTTHFHEMREYLADLSNHGGVEPLSLGSQDGSQTYRISPGFVKEKTFAYEIAKKYGLEYSETAP